MARCAGVISERLAFKAAISLYFSLLTGNFAAENRFAQACLHRQPVWDLLSPAAHGPKSIILRPEKRKRLGDRDLQPLLIASSRAKPTIFLRRQVGWFPFAGGQSHGTSFAKARREPSVRPDYALPISLGLRSASQSRTFSLPPPTANKQCFAGRKAANATGMGPRASLARHVFVPRLRFFSADSLGTSLSLEPGKRRTFV